jgi:hypothetical protein
MEEGPQYPRERLPGREHIPLYPKNFVVCRVIQLVLALATTGLTAYGVHTLVSAADCIMLFTVSWAVWSTLYVHVLTDVGWSGINQLHLLYCLGEVGFVYLQLLGSRGSRDISDCTLARVTLSSWQPDCSLSWWLHILRILRGMLHEGSQPGGEDIRIFPGRSRDHCCCGTVSSRLPLP